MGKGIGYDAHEARRLEDVMPDPCNRLRPRIGIEVEDMLPRTGVED